MRTMEAKYAYFDSFFWFFFLRKKEKEKGKKERFEKGDYCNQQQTFITFHGKLEISDEWN